MMKITWYGTASLMLEDQETKLVFDPFSSLPLKGSYSGDNITFLPFYQQYREADAVFITHGHFDHIYYIPDLYQDLDTKIYATHTPLQTLLHRGMRREQLMEIAPGFSAEFGSLKLTAYHGRHCRFDSPMIRKKLRSPYLWKHIPHLLYELKLNRAYPENGEILFYEVTDGQKRIQIMGSMNLDKDVDYPTGADLLVLPLQGRSDQDEYALQIVSRLKPKAVVLDHYDNAFPPITDSVGISGFIENVREQFVISCSPLQPAETIEV